jgi:ATP-dependent HslUV protease, peptidase subunit HslV
MEEVVSTVTVVKKNGYVAIAADTLLSHGSMKLSADYNRTCSKIVRWGDSFLGMTGWAATQQAIDHAIRTARGQPALASWVEIFEVFRVLHTRLKEESFLNPRTDPSDAFESSQMSVLIANPHGIFSIGSLRTVIEYERFWAAGSGAEFALGAMYASYDTSTALETAVAGVRAAIEFDAASAAPIEAHVQPMMQCEIAELESMMKL